MTHDVSAKLREIESDLPGNVRAKLDRLCDVSKSLRRDRGWPSTEAKTSRHRNFTTKRPCGRRWRNPTKSLSFFHPDAPAPEKGAWHLAELTLGLRPPQNVFVESSQLSTQLAQMALKNLKDALSIAAPTPLERDGTIQRFEYSYEMTWKLARRILKENEIEAEIPKAVFRELGRIGWIDNVEDWLEFQKSRNETSHEYGEKLARKSYLLAQRFLPLAENLIQVLKQKANG